MKRIALGVLLLAGCSERSTGAGDAGGDIVDATEHCLDYGFWICRRDEFAGRITSPEFEACVEDLAGMCEGAAWPSGCAPTEDQSQACTSLLQRQDLALLTTEELLTMYDDCDLCE